MPKTKEELNAIKEEVEAVNEKLQELSKEELAQVNGGVGHPVEPEPAGVEFPVTRPEWPTADQQI